MINLCIFHNEEKENAKNIYFKLLDFLNGKKINILEEKDIKNADFVVVIGGDGTLLRNFKKIENNNTKVIAINAGKLGFITEIRGDNFEEIFEDIFSENYNLEERYFLEIFVNGKKYEGLNEVFLTRNTIKKNVVSSKIYVDNKFLGEFKGDGVIISTPTGSTAYSLSAGGPVVTPELKLFLITPIAPHNLNTRPIILSGDKKITLELSSSESAYLNIDGDNPINILKKDKIEIKFSSNKLKLIIPRDRNYYEVLREKLKWGENLC